MIILAPRLWIWFSIPLLSHDFCVANHAIVWRDMHQHCYLIHFQLFCKVLLCFRPSQLWIKYLFGARSKPDFKFYYISRDAQYLLDLFTVRIELCVIGVSLCGPWSDRILNLISCLDDCMPFLTVGPQLFGNLFHTKVKLVSKFHSPLIT